MGALPPFKRFSTEDYPEQAGWIGKLFTQLNLLITSLYSNLNNGLTLSQNVLSQVVTLPVDGAVPAVSFSYKYSPNSPIGMSVLNVVQTNVPAVVLTDAVGVSWAIDTGVITAAVQGLDAASQYNVTFVVWGG